MAQEAHELKQGLMALSKQELVERFIALQERRLDGYDDAKFEFMCEQIMEGRTAREVFRSEDENDKAKRPGRSTFYRWINNDEVDKVFRVRERYQFALDVKTHDMNDEILEIADDGSNDYMEILGDEQGESDDKPGVIGYRINGENIQRSKLRVDARERYMARTSPKKWGSRNQDPDAKNTTIKDRVIEMHSVSEDEVPDVTDA